MRIGSSLGVRVSAGGQQVQPYAILGAGGIEDRVSGRGDWSAYVNVGLGLLWPLADWGRLTLDARYRWDDNQGEIGRDDNFDDVLVTLGLQIPLGPKPRVAEAPRAAPPDVEVIQQLIKLLELTGSCRAARHWISWAADVTTM
jgi:hypothetical protein